MSARLFSFVGGEIGPWRVVDMSTVVGGAVADVTRLNIVTGVFDELVAELRATEEWAYVDREIDIRVARDGA